MTETKNFNIFVIVLVVLTGLGFSFFTGLIYSASPVWISIAAIVGVLTSFILARKYLFWLGKISTWTRNRKKIWSLGTLAAIICGIVCTTVVHGVMTAQLAIELKQMPLHLMDGLWLPVVLISEAVGASAGLIAGGICSLVYVLKIKDKSRETV